MLCCRKTISFDKSACLKSTRHIQTLFDISFQETKFLLEAANSFVKDFPGEFLTRWKSRFPFTEPIPPSKLKPTLGFIPCGLVNKFKRKKSKTEIYGALKRMVNPQTNDYIPLNGVYRNQKNIKVKVNQKRRPRLLIPVNKPSLHQRFLKIAENTNPNQSTPNLLIFKRKFGGILSDFNKLHVKNENVTAPLNPNSKKSHLNRYHASMHAVSGHVKPRVNVKTYIRKLSGSEKRLYKNINDRLKKIDHANLRKIDANMGDYIVPQRKLKFATDNRKLSPGSKSFNKRLKEVNKVKIDKTLSEKIHVKGISYRIL